MPAEQQLPPRPLRVEQVRFCHRSALPLPLLNSAIDKLEDLAMMVAHHAQEQHAIIVREARIGNDTPQRGEKGVFASIEIELDFAKLSSAQHELPPGYSQTSYATSATEEQSAASRFFRSRNQGTT